MKRLSRQERTGVLILAAVSLMTVGGAWLIRSRSIGRGLYEELPPVTVIYRDTTADRASEQEDPARRSRKANKSTKSGKRGRKRERKPAESPVRRDPLSEPVRVK